MPAPSEKPPHNSPFCQIEQPSPGSWRCTFRDPDNGNVIGYSVEFSSPVPCWRFLALLQVPFPEI
jgi:hypothetical protein